MSFTDKTLECVDCGNEFVFTAGEQEFYSQKGFTNEPRRCPTCRQSKKSQRNEGGSRSSFGGGGGGARDSYGSGRDSYGGGRDSYGSSSRDSYGSSSRSSFGGGNSRGFGGGGGGGGQREMFEAVCAECGKPTTVPFKPTQGRPVYCRDCFQQQRNSRW
jgi:CxxC-x17-CxxC domain-containing protein